MIFLDSNVAIRRREAIGPSTDALLGLAGGTRELALRRWVCDTLELPGWLSWRRSEVDAPAR